MHDSEPAKSLEDNGMEPLGFEFRGGSLPPDQTVLVAS